MFVSLMVGYIPQTIYQILIYLRHVISSFGVASNIAKLKEGLNLDIVTITID